MKKGSVFFLLGIVLLFSLTFISAQEQQGGQFSKQGALYMDSGIIVNTLVYDTIELNKDIYLYMTPYEQSGKTLDSTTVDCRVGIVSPDGSRLYLLESNDNFTIIGNDDIWVGLLPGTFLNETGEYLFNWDCQGTIRGGYFNSHVLVTKTGENLEESESLIYLALAFGVLLLFFLSFYFMLSTPYSNKVNENGAVIKITKLKYVKLALILLTWVLFTWFLNILIGLSDNFVSLTMYYGFFGFIFKTMNNLALPVGILVLIIAFFEIIKDSNIYGNIKKFGSAYK